MNVWFDDFFSNFSNLASWPLDKSEASKRSAFAHFFCKSTSKSLNLKIKKISKIHNSISISFLRMLIYNFLKIYTFLLFWGVIFANVERYR